MEGRRRGRSSKYYPPIISIKVVVFCAGSTWIEPTICYSRTIYSKITPVLDPSGDLHPTHIQFPRYIHAYYAQNLNA
jgi:hypothetical protein